MQVTVKTTKFSLTPAIAAHLSRKLENIARMLSRIESSAAAKQARGRALITARIELERTTRHHRKGIVFRAEANLDVPGRAMLRAEAQGETLHLAIDRMRDELQREIKKWKERSVTRVREGGRALKRRIRKT